MWWVLLSLGLVGCDVAFSLDEPPGTCLVDDFDDGVIDPITWSVYAPADPVATVVETDGLLRISIPQNQNGLNGLEILPADPFEGSTARVELVRAPLGERVEPQFYATFDLDNHYILWVRDGMLANRIRVDGVDSYGMVAYSTVDHRFLQMRHDRAAELMYFEASPDGSRWTTLRAVPALVPSRLRVGLLLVAYNGGEAMTSVAEFDQFSITTRDCRLP